MKKSDYTLNEKDSLQDILNVEKQIMGLYGTAISEATTKNMRSLLKANLWETAEDQFSVFEAMKQNDYYQVVPASKAVMDEQADKFKTIQTELKP